MIGLFCVRRFWFVSILVSARSRFPAGRTSQASSAMPENRNWAVRIRCPPRTVVWPAVQVILLIPETMVGFDSFSDVSFFSYASLSWMWRHALYLSLWLSDIGTCAMFWWMESNYIIVTGTLWINLRMDVSPTASYHPRKLTMLPWLCYAI